LDLFSKCEQWTEAREVKALGLYPYFHAIDKAEGTEVEVHGKRLVMAGSNNYLGLTKHPAVVQAAHDALDRYGTSCTGSRFLNGTLEMHEELERRLARFARKEAALVFSTGFQVNLGTISALITRDDVVLMDREAHASIVDGCRLGLGDVVRFRHNDLDDLERRLARLPETVGKLVVVDGVYSMLGDLAPLPELVAVCKRHGARLMVDEAHGLGVLGATGRGACEELGVENDVDLVMGTFSKSFASIGGFVAGPQRVIDYLKHHARSLIFSASMPPATTAATLAALGVIEEEGWRRDRVRSIGRQMKAAFTARGLTVGDTQTPIVSIIVGERYDTLRAWKGVYDNGVYVNCIVAPATPANRCLLRTSYIATHTDDQLAAIVEGVSSAVHAVLGQGAPLAHANGNGHAAYAAPTRTAGT
jgi:8-amino-7-oxononanoate synthase